MNELIKFKWSCEGRRGGVWATSIEEAMDIIKLNYPDLNQPIYIVQCVETPINLILGYGDYHAYEDTTGKIKHTMHICANCKWFYCHSAIDRDFYCKNGWGLRHVLAVERDSFCSYWEEKTNKVVD